MNGTGENAMENVRNIAREHELEREILMKSYSTVYMTMLFVRPFIESNVVLRL